MKICSGCNQKKEIEGFWKHSGRIAQCKSCEGKKNSERIRKYFQTISQYRKKRNEYQRKYNRDHGLKSIGAMHRLRFGGLREEVLERDDYQCVICEMTDKEHMEKWDRHLTLDHKDGYGRKVKLPHNLIENLQTLCLSCHGRIEAQRYWQGRA